MSQIRKAFTEIDFVTYRDDYKTKPNVGVSIIHSSAGRTPAEMRRQYERELAMVRRHPKSFVRLECVRTTEIMDADRIPYDYSDYCPPSVWRHAAMSIELQVRLKLCNEPGGWVHVAVDSYRDRELLAEDIIARGKFAIDGTEHEIFGLAFVDRELIWDSEWVVNHGKVASPVAADRAWTKTVAPLLPVLRELSEKEAAMTRSEIVDHCLTRLSEAPEAKLFRAVNAVVEATDKDDDVQRPSLARFERLAALLQNGVDIGPAIEQAIIGTYPSNLRDKLRKAVDTHRGAR